MSTEFTGEQKLRIVLESIIRGVPKEEQCTKYSITPEQFQAWHDQLIKNGGKIYDEEKPAKQGRSSRTKKIKYVPWYVSSVLLLSILVNLGGAIVFGVWKMASTEQAESISKVFTDITGNEPPPNVPPKETEPVLTNPESMDLESLLKQVDEFGKDDGSFDPLEELPPSLATDKKLELKNLLTPSLKLPSQPETVDLASEVMFLNETYEGKHVVYLMDVGSYQLEGEGAGARLDRMKVSVLESITKLSPNSYFNLVLCWNLREAHALGKTILRASDENKQFATDWITSIKATPEGLKEGRNQFYPKELLYAKPLAGVVGPWYGLATAMSYDPDLIFFLVGNMPKFNPEEVSRLDFNGLGIKQEKLSQSVDENPGTGELKDLVRKTAGYWLIALQSERNLPETPEDIQDIAMTRLGLNDWSGLNKVSITDVPWGKAFDNFLAGLELGINKIPQVYAFQTLPKHVVWPSSLQGSMAEFCESSLGKLGQFP